VSFVNTFRNPIRVLNGLFEPYKDILYVYKKFWYVKNIALTAVMLKLKYSLYVTIGVMCFIVLPAIQLRILTVIRRDYA
jgi:hypothetical protein